MKRSHNPVVRLSDVETEKELLKGTEFQSFDTYLDLFERRQKLRSIIRSGVIEMQGALELAEALVSVKKKLPSLLPSIGDEVARLESARTATANATELVQSDFALFNNLMTLAEWAALEQLVTDFAAEWLLRIGIRAESPVWEKIKLSVGECFNLEEPDRSALVVERMQELANSRLQFGVNRFESLLKLLRLDGRIDEQVGLALFEMSCLRNAIAHGRHFADRRIVAKCSTLNLQEGDPLNVSTAQLHRYTRAAFLYTSTLVRRMTAVQGEETTELPVSFTDPVNCFD